MARSILMCGGSGERWGDYLGVPKHIVPIDGEPLLNRTVRQIRRFDPTGTVIVVGFDPRYQVEGAELHAPNHGPTDFCDTDKFLSSYELWSEDEDTVMFYGDCYISDKAMKTILRPGLFERTIGALDDQQFLWFGRFGPNQVTKTTWPEMFALRMSPGCREKIGQDIQYVKEQLLAGNLKRGGGWESYRKSVGIDPKEHLKAGHFCDIHDLTDDFDFPADYENWREAYERHQSRWQRAKDGLKVRIYMLMEPMLLRFYRSPRCVHSYLWLKGLCCGNPNGS